MLDLERVAESIWSNAQRGVYYPAEWRDRLDLDQAYTVQLKLLERYERAGERQAGWKVGLTARAMQIQQGVHEPCFGFLLQSGHLRSGADLRFADLIQPGFENELCLTVGTTLRGPGVTLEQAQAAIAAVAPALEIIERRGEFSGQLPLALADNAQQKAFVTGPETRRPPAGFRLAGASVEVVVNGQSMERASGSAVLGDPAASIAWLANKLAEFDRALEAGQRVMSGSFTRQYSLTAGDRVESRFDPFGSVAVACR